MKKLAFIIVGLLALSTATFAEPAAPIPVRREAASQKPPYEFHVKAHTVFDNHDMSGPGAGTAASETMDFTLFERMLGLKSLRLNKSGVVITGYDLGMVPGSSFTTNEHFTGRYNMRGGLSLSATSVLYTVSGNPDIGRRFGEEQPFDPYRFDARRQLVPASSPAFYNAVLDNQQGRLKYKLVVGTFIPEMSTGATFNYLRLAHVLYRPPLPNETFLEKDDRQLEGGRHPLFGGYLLADIPGHGVLKSARVEVLRGSSRPTPLNVGLHRTTTGGRVALDLTPLNLGLSYFNSEGDRFPTVLAEHQTQLAMDTSVRLSRPLALYGLLSGTHYTRPGAGAADGKATVIGMNAALSKEFNAKLQYQDVTRSYDLAGGQHKNETFPPNFHGLVGELTWTFPKDRGKAFLWYYDLVQSRNALAPGEPTFTFADPYFSSLTGSGLGGIKAFRLYGDYLFPGDKFRLKGYFEGTTASKSAPTSANNVGQTNIDGVLYLSYYLRKDLSLDLGYRRATAVGNFQNRSFNSVTSIPKVGFMWKPGGDTRLSLLYNLYRFNDRNPQSGGLNDFRNNQLITEFYTRF